jgi:CHAT domain-containing protein/tetratricopeptide (TPR) repeat protein
MSGKTIICLIALEVFSTLGAIADISGSLREQLVQAREARESGDYAKAEVLAQRLVELAHGLVPSDPVFLAKALHEAGQAELLLGRFDAGSKSFAEELEISRPLQTAEPNLMARALADLGELSSQTWDYQNAKKKLEEGEALCQDKTADGKLLLAFILRDLGEAETGLSQFSLAESHIQAALQTLKTILGDSSPETITAMNGVAELRIGKRQMKEAEDLSNHILEQRKKVRGENHPETAQSQAQLGYVRYIQGDYAAAEPLFLRAKETLTTDLGPEHPAVLSILNFEGMLKIRLGLYDQAEPLLQQALTGRRKCYGEESPATAESLNNLAAVYYKKHDLEKAASLLEESLAITEKKLGDSPDTADSANNLGRVFQKLKKYDKAEEFFVRSLNIRRATLPPGHPDTAVSEFVLAKLYDEEGKFGLAEPLLQQSVSEFSTPLGPLHRDLINFYYEYALNQLDLGHRDQAIDAIRKYTKASEALLANVLTFTTEEERLGFREAQDPFSLLVSAHLSEDLANVILRWKGIVLDSLLEDKIVASQEGDPVINDLVNSLRVQYDALDKLPRELAANSPQAKADLTSQEAIRSKINDLEKQLAERVSGYGRVNQALQVTYQDVQSALSGRMTLVEFIRCRVYQGKGVWLDKYGALLIPHEGIPNWIELGDAGTIDSAILQLQPEVAAKSADLHSLCRKLYDLLVAPITANLATKVDRLVLCPDGELNFLPFAALLTPDDTFFCQHYTIGYVSSGRDLLRRAKSMAPRSNEVVEIFANPDFSLHSSAPLVVGKPEQSLYRELGQSLSSQITLRSLPGTVTEATLIRRMAEANGVKEIVVLQGKEASKAALLRLKSPWVLHLATHAFVLSKDRLPIENPMHRCGLALAGAQDTLRSWAQSDFPSPETDGIILADEVGRLALQGTWLVTLSACETGAGEADIGEGVLGLRRGFTMAGAENLLFTLWRISDAETAEFMSAFYRRALSSRDVFGALAETQRDTLVRLRQEESLGMAIQRAGPFMLSAQAGLGNR